MLNSKSHLSVILFYFLAVIFISFWIATFIGFIIVGDDFNITKLILIPVLIIPFGMLFIFQDSLNRFKFSNKGITVYKMLFFKFKTIDWKNLDYTFNTIENGKSGSSKVIYLVKNKSLVLKIPENIYKNYNDINNYILLNIENKGYIKLNFFESFKYFTKGKINKLS